MNKRITTIAKKEFLQLIRDRRTLPLVLLMPVVLVILFGYVVARDVDHITFAVFDQDKSALSRQIAERIEKSGFFINTGEVKGYAELEKRLDQGEIKIGLVIPLHFAREIADKANPSLQVLVDGTNSNTASIALNYFTNILNNIAEDIVKERLVTLGLGNRINEPVVLKSRVYYNPELRAVNYMVPGLMVIVLVLVTTMLTALSIVREKESGTIEQIMVTPVKPWELILGKILPFPLVGLFSAALAIIFGGLWFVIPIKGSVILLFLCTVLFIMTNLGMGLLISAVSATQQQAMMTTVFFIIPNILLSGFVFPIANMPKILQWITLFIPGRYFLEIVRGIYLKGTGVAYLYPQILALAGLGVLILGYAMVSFKKQLV